MKATSIRKAVAALRATHGEAGALSYAATQVRKRALEGDEPAATCWRAIVAELRFLARPPQTSQLDIYRAAHILLGTYGEAVALLLLAERARTDGPMHTGLYPLLRAAVQDLARREPGWQDLLQ